MDKNVLAILTTILVYGACAQQAFAQPAVAGLVTISGTVTDDPFPSKRASMPVQGVRVSLLKPLAVLAGQPAGVLPAPIAGVLLDSAVTNAQGRFSFKPESAGSYQLSFNQSGFVSRQIDVYTTTDTAVTVALLAAGATAKLAGTIWTPCPVYLNCLRQPVPGCTVSVVIGGSTILPLAKARASAVPISAITRQAVSGAGGQYSIDSLPITFNGEQFTVTASKAGLVGQSADTSFYNTATTTLDFSLVAVQPAAGDTVYVAPAKPTAIDSLTFTLFNAAHNCCTVYPSKSVTVQDTSVYLIYSVIDTQACACLVAGSTTAFKNGPVPAGRYVIYKVETPYCASGTVCPPIAFLPQRVGSMTVAPSSSVLAAAPDPARGASLSLGANGRSISVTIDQNGRMTLRIYDVRGKTVARLYDGWTNAGSRTFSLNIPRKSALAPGAVLLELSIDGVQRIVLPVSIVR